MNCYVFVHVPRTAGSSIWHHLAYQGADEGIGVYDIYHESLQKFGVPGCSDRFLADDIRQIDLSSCLFHHHSRESVFEHFAAHETVFATLLRDPVDRFISDVFHFRRVFRNAAASGRLADHITRSWSEHFTSSLCQADLPDGELLKRAARERTFQNFYVQFFATMCWNVPQAESLNSPVPSYTSQEIHQLAQDIRRHFQVIGWFGTLQQSLSDIQAAFQMSSGGMPLTHTINKGHDRPLIGPAQRLRYSAAFEADYQLLDELRALTPFQKASRRVLRKCQQYVPFSANWVDETLPLAANRPVRDRQREVETEAGAMLV
jgi:hypothetical protein